MENLMKNVLMSKNINELGEKTSKVTMIPFEELLNVLGNLEGNVKGSLDNYITRVYEDFKAVWNQVGIYEVTDFSIKPYGKVYVEFSAQKNVKIEHLESLAELGFCFKDGKLFDSDRNRHLLISFMKHYFPKSVITRFEQSLSSHVVIDYLIDKFKVELSLKEIETFIQQVK